MRERLGGGVSRGAMKLDGIEGGKSTVIDGPDAITVSKVCQQRFGLARFKALALIAPAPVFQCLHRHPRVHRTGQIGPGNDF